jgi:hypothetical protein
MGSRSALLWLTHVWGQELQAEYAKFCRMKAGDAPDVWLLLDSSTPGAAGLAERHQRCHRFDEENLFRLPYPRLAGHGLVNHPHFPVLDFFLSHRDYDTYWVIEYDVRYTGEWESLLRAFQDFDHDLVTCHVRRFAEEPRWPWWDSFHHPTKVIPQDRYVRSFNVIYRISNRALEFIHQAQVEGWRGYPEVSWPTLLLDGGLTLLDFGGSGSFSRPPHRNRFYTSRGTSSGFLSVFGTMRYRPSRAKPGGRPNMLYHPVKPEGMLETRMAKLRIAARMAVECIRDIGWR